MKQTIIRLFSLLLLGMVAMGAQATPYKNIYVTLDASPSGAGTVYMVVNSGDTNTKEESEHKTDHVDFKATIGEEASNNVPYYYCNLYATPEPGYDFLGFARKNDTGVYTDADLIGSTNPLKVNVNADDVTTEGENNYADVKARNDWHSTPDHQFVAIFKTQDVSVNNVTVERYQPLFSGEQDDSFGTWTSEMIDGGTKVKLTALPAAGMRFVCWRDAAGNQVSTEEEMTVNNVNTTFKIEFDLQSWQLPAELSTYSNAKQVRYDNWNNEGLVAYKVTAINDKLTLVQVRHAGPGKGVILQGVAGQTYQMSYQGLFLDEDNSDNLLKGTASGPVTANGKIYVLAKKNQGLGFYKLADGAEVPQGKAYLEIDDANNARDFFGFDDGTTTSISSVTEVEQTTPVYNMAGQRVSGSFSGLVIQNGRKYIRK